VKLCTSFNKLHLAAIEIGRMKMPTLTCLVVLISWAVVGEALKSDCSLTWTQHVKSGVPGLVNQAGITTVEACKAACEKSQTCWNLDFDFRANSCWFGTAHNPSNRAPSTYVDHWDLNCAASCKDIKTDNPDAESRVYTIKPSNSEVNIQVYCEMGLNGGGYTFLSSGSLPLLTTEDLQAIFTDKTSFLLRIRKCNNGQPYIVFKQLEQYRDIDLKLGLNENNNYGTPVHVGILGKPYLYFGFLPVLNADNRRTQGVWANGNAYTYQYCGSSPNSYFALFANYNETAPNNYAIDIDFPLCNQILGSARINPSKREMPVEYFYFAEFHLGGCGCYTITDARLDNKCITSFAMGFR